MSHIPETLRRRVVREMVPEESHLIWPKAQRRVRYLDSWYDVRAVLMNEPTGNGYTLARHCSRPGCINPDHLERISVAEKQMRNGTMPRKTISYCKTCNFLMRDQKEKLADNPGTRVYNKPGQCRTCYNREYQRKKRQQSRPSDHHVRQSFADYRVQVMWDTLLPPGDKFEFDHDVVRRNVPQDLWETFGVK